MAIVPLPLADQSNPGRDYRDGSGRLINCYMEPRGKEGRWPTPVYPVDGLETFAELPVQTQTEDEGFLLMQTGDNLLTEDDDRFLLEGDPFEGQANDANKGVQQLIPANGYLWAITGSGVYKVDQGGNTTFIGGIAGSSQVTASANERVYEIGIVSDGNYYVLDTLNDTLTNLTSSLFYGGPNSVVQYDGYMVVTHANGGYQISGIDDASSWATGDAVEALYRGDGLLRALTRGADLVLFGSRSIEFWQTTGASDFALSRVTATEVGLGPPMSAINLDEVILFVDQDYSVRMMNGYSTQVVSTHYVSRKIRQSTDKSSLRATSYERDGHLFYSISCADFTLTYNLKTQLWHEEKTEGMNRRIINAVGRLGEYWYAGNYKEGIVYRMDNDVHKDGTSNIIMEVITPPVHSFPDRVRIRSLFVDALFGTALAADVTDDESDPKLMVWISEDDGENFIFLEELSLGDINSKYEELRIQGIGTSDQNGFVFRLTCSTPVVRGILGISADITKVRA